MEKEFTRVYLLLGSNLGNRLEHLEKAVKLLNTTCGKVALRSSVYETAAWGNTDQPSFYNLALLLHTSIQPLALMDQLLAIEKEIGRVRHAQWGPRIIDIDIIFYGNLIISEKNKLNVPHPEMQNRKFVLLPLSEIAGNFLHPVFQKTVNELLVENEDPLPVTKLS